MAYPYYLSPQNLVFYDIPLFLLFFGLSFLIIRFTLKLQDPVSNTASAAFSAGLAYILVRSQSSIYIWFLWHWSMVFGVIIALIILGLSYMLIKAGLI